MDVVSILIMETLYKPRTKDLVKITIGRGKVPNTILGLAVGNSFDLRVETQTSINGGRLVETVPRSVLSMGP